MTGEEFEDLQEGNILLEYASMRHWMVVAKRPGAVVIQTTRVLPNPSKIELEGWRVVVGLKVDPPPF